MGKYDKLNAFIIENVGGDSNIIALTHCVTRLRFTLKDESLVNRDALINHEKIMTAQSANGQYQVVVGMQVGEIYQEMLSKLSISNTNEETSTNDSTNKDKKTLLNRFIDTITKIITPTLGVMIGCSLILGVESLLVASKVISPGDGAFVILNAIGYALFTFFPVILGYTSAKTFNSDPFIGMIVGASLVFPNLLNDLVGPEAIYQLFNGTFLQMDIYSDFLGIPIIFPANGYTSTVIPIIFSMFFLSKFEHFIKKIIPQSLHFTFVPFLTLIIGVPATILVFGPIANIASSIISSAILALFSFSPVVAALFVGILYTPLVILGLHWPLVAIGINNLATTGTDYLLPMIFTAPLAQMAVVFAVYLKTKNPDVKKICVPAMVSDFFCIIEPSIYGVTLPVKRRFVFTCIGTAIGALIIAVAGVHNFASTIGVLGIGGFINPQTGDVSYVIVVALASLATMLISFLLAFFTFKEA
ncbi:PTS beta-glucoside transporter subunit EIIBCA [Listeria monocytogenes]|uniref:PTS transporter subunit EIIC n=1 Tax=Listeria TaxID=1637 RepID=UPI000854DAC9|nr:MULTISPECIES: PTS transporter subunit EIIC [Listeria]EAC7885962.1 PTS beta-glucoside transporter subunit IIBCA [Listeria monocytogenes]EAD7213538.1 PTS beta-glucoside transporter subunit IIBCA [Listeria monocytogenes]EAD7603508.1 PTS beta-glucoside transporter subunit IIBCA [Listeria monocytogenes]EAE1302320.1 PTS beta-glucoside transporter subunit IIBCA [Listeria monocytogenes]EAG9261311.1 PTS beta-glucoside transporter subunit IIBCA [Listeria monocytogenes]